MWLILIGLEQTKTLFLINYSITQNKWLKTKLKGEKMEEWKVKLKQYTYYILIAALSIISLIVFPMLGSSAEINNTFPTDEIGWTTYIIIRCIVVLMNMLIFSNFLLQAKVNISEDESYKAANEILGKIKPKNYKPRSPSQYLWKTYLTKGTILIITTICSLFVIGNAILNYDYMILIATIFTVITSIIFGVMSMRRTELYYTSEYLDYANYIKENQDDNN